MKRSQGTWLLLVLAVCRSALAEEFDARQLDSATNQLASEATVTTSNGGSLGIPSGGSTQNLAAQTSIAWGNAASFLTRIGRLPLRSWCTLDVGAELAPHDVPSTVSEASRTEPAVLKSTSYESISLRATFGRNIGTNLRERSSDALVSSCCAHRSSLLQSTDAEADLAACGNAADRLKCLFEKKLERANLASQAVTCADEGVPLDAATLCNAEDIMLLRAKRAEGPRLTAGLRLLYPGSVPVDSKTVADGSGIAAEVQAQWAWSWGQIYASAAGLLLRSWEESAGSDLIEHLATREGRISVGGRLLATPHLAGGFYVSVARNHWEDEVASTVGDEATAIANEDNRFEAGLHLSFASGSVSGTLKINLVKPFDGALETFDDYQLDVSIVPVVGIGI